MQAIAWLISVAVCVALLIVAPRFGTGLVIKCSVGAIIGGTVLVVMIALALRGLKVQPSHAFTTALFQLLFTAVVAAMLNIMNFVFHGMVNAQIAFHKRYNAANLHRFPISFLIGYERQLKMFGTMMWCFGSALMLYGVWFDMKV
ncbi:hypothetical protein [Sphingomonas sp. ERG5]|uniref:hypothetical protein n=1 Tax=Sphingomonas sp. ERG5 TaxID=1381597 RepID=UPI00054B96FF|nr:hypothetical protein [Sphingomonas sp. ERG5]